MTLGQSASIFLPVKPAVKAVAVAASTFPTLRDAVESWITKKEAMAEVKGKKGLRGSSPKAYRTACAKWLYPTLGDLPIDKISRKQVGAVLSAMADKSISLIQHVRNPVRGMFQEQVDQEDLTVNPAADLKSFIGDVKRVQRHEFFAEQEGKAIIETARKVCPWWAGFVVVGFKAGLRWGEIAALYKSAVDVKKGKLNVVRSWSPCEHRANDEHLCAPSARRYQARGQRGQAGSASRLLRLA